MQPTSWASKKFETLRRRKNPIDCLHNTENERKTLN